MKRIYVNEHLLPMVASYTESASVLMRGKGDSTDAVIVCP